jgi:hypothetical protein
MSEKPRFHGKFISTAQEKRLKTLSKFRNNSKNMSVNVEDQGREEDIDFNRVESVEEDHAYCKQTDNPILHSFIEVGHESDDEVPFIIGQQGGLSCYIYIFFL